MAFKTGRQARTLDPRDLIPLAERRSGENLRDRRALSNALSDSCVKYLSPTDVAKDPVEKRLGRTSKGLRIDDFELITTIGVGGIGRVWLAQLSDTEGRFKENVKENVAENDQQRVFALKVVRKADVVERKQIAQIRCERQILAAVSGHPFIAAMITSFSDSDCLYMVLDYCPGGELRRHLRDKGKFEVPVAKFYAAEIYLIIHFLQQFKHVAHRDLKPENLVLDAEGHLKLIDFGLAKVIDDGPTYTQCGTYYYMAPEVLTKEGHTTAVDWWALGVILYQLLVGVTPFWNSNRQSVMENIVKNRIDFPAEVPSHARDLISRLCSVDPSCRLGNTAGGPNQVAVHPFFADIHWPDLYNRTTPGPIVPELEHAADPNNFHRFPDADPEYARMHPYTEDMRNVYDEFFSDF